MRDPRHLALATDLHARRYHDVAATALLHLHSLAQLRSRPGYETTRYWGHGPHHEELRRLGLVTIGEPKEITGLRPVDLTEDGRAVAEILADIRRVPAPSAGAA